MLLVSLWRGEQVLLRKTYADPALHGRQPQLTSRALKDIGVREPRPGPAGQHYRFGPGLAVVVRQRCGQFLAVVAGRPCVPVRAAVPYSVFPFG